MTASQDRSGLSGLNSISTRLIIFFMLFALAPMLIVGWVAFNQAEASLRQQVGEAATELAESSREEVETFMAARRGDIQTLAHSRVLTSPEQPAAEKLAFLRDFYAAYGVYKAVYVTDTNGQIVAATDGTTGDQSDAEWFKSPRQGEIYVSDITSSDAYDGYILTLSAEIIDEGGQGYGVVAAHVDARALFELVRDEKLGASGEIFLVDRQGKIAVGQLDSDIRTDVSMLQSVKAALAGQRGTYLDTSFRSGELVLYASVPPSGQEGWSALAMLPMSELNGPIEALALRIAVVAAIVTFFAGLLVVQVTRQVVQPIIQLDQFALRISTGNYKVEIPIYDNSEIGRLAASFRAMVEAVRQRDTDLTNLNESLEGQNQRLAGMYTIGQAVNSTFDLNEILSRLADEFMRVANATHGAVLLADQEKGYFERLSLHGFTVEETHRAESQHLKIDQGLNGQAFQTRQIVRVDDVRSRPEYYSLIESTRSEMVVPIVRAGEVLGNVDLQSPEVGAFRAVDLDYMQALADLTAPAIANARLFQELKSYNDDLKLAVDERTQQLEVSKNRVETILSSVGDALMVLRKDGRIDQVNTAFERQTGYSAVEAERQNHHDLLKLELEPKSDYLTALEMLFPGQVWEGETKVQRKDGGIYDAALTIAPVRDPQGLSRLLVASIRDISTLKEVERLKNEFVSNVSHELRTPITGITLNLDLLKHDPAGSERYVARMTREANRLNVLIEDLLRLSRLEQGRVELKFDPTNLSTVASQYVTDRQPLAESRGITLTLGSHDKIPLVPADEGLLGQALSVLLTNALNYTPSGGSVTIAAVKKEVDGESWAGINVADSGPGISPEEREALFKRFYRGKVGRASHSPGTGLGLAIAREIIERHHGSIEVASEGIPGKGVTFTLWLPVKEGSHEQRSAESK